MGMYTALEVNLKLRYNDDIMPTLARELFISHDDDDDALQRMFWTDGGISFGPPVRRLEWSMGECPGCSDTDHGDRWHTKSYLHLYTRSSYKGMTHTRLIDWLKPVIVAGYVRWRHESLDNEVVEDFGSLPISDAESVINDKVKKLESEIARSGILARDRYEMDLEIAQDCLSAVRAVGYKLPDAVVNAYRKCKDDTPRSLKHEIERLMP